MSTPKPTLVTRPIPTVGTTPVTPTPTPTPVVDTAYNQIIQVAATAICNIVLQRNNLHPAQNCLELVDAKVKQECILYAQAAVRAVSQHGERQAAKVNAAEVKEEMKEATCQHCNAVLVESERDAMTQVTRLRFDCGGEVLAFEIPPREGGGVRVTTRRECPKVKAPFTDDEAVRTAKGQY